MFYKPYYFYPAIIFIIFVFQKLQFYDKKVYTTVNINKHTLDAF